MENVERVRLGSFAWGCKVVIKAKDHDVVVEFETPRRVYISVDGFEIGCRYPDEFFEALNEMDENKIAFMKKLAETGLDPDKHKHFDLNKLEWACKLSKVHRDIAEEWNELMGKKPRRPVVVAGYLFILDSRWSEYYRPRLQSFIAKVLTNEPKYFRVKMTPQTFVKIYRSGKVAKALRSLYVKEISEEEFVDRVVALVEHGSLVVSGFGKYLPEVAPKLMEMKLGNA
jgi:hypothetical protein